MAIDAGKIVATLELETGAFSGGLNTAKGLLATFGNEAMSGRDKLAALGTAATSLGKTLTTAVTLPLVAMGTAAVATFTGFDDAMRQVRATMGLYDESNEATKEQIDLLTDAAKEMGATTRYSASEAAEALNYLALAGYDAEKAVDALPKVLQLAQAGGLSLATASDMVTDSMSALGLETEQLSGFIDQMAVTSQKSNTSVAQLGTAILTVGATAKSLKGGTTELNAELGILADSGIKGAEGGTYLRNVMLALMQPTSDGAKALEKYTSGVFDAEGNMRSLNDILLELKTNISGMSDSERMDVLGAIFNKRDLAAAQVLIAGAGERFNELTGYINESAGAAEGMAEVMEGGIGGSFRNLKSATEGLAIAFGEELAPKVQTAADGVTGLVRWFTELDEGTRKTITTIGTVAAVVGPTLLVVGKLTSMFASLNPVVAGVTVGIMGLVAAISYFKGLGNWQTRLDAKLGVKMDESELENYKIDTTEIDGGDVTAEINLILLNKGKSAADQIIDILSDGKRETEYDVKTMNAAVYGIIDEVYDDVKAYWDGKRETLKQLLDAGIIDQAQFDAQMLEYDAAQGAMEAELTQNAQAVTDYIATLVEANRAPTEAEIAHLQELIDKLVEVGVEAETATNAVQNAYRASYERIKSGNAVEGDAEKAATYVEMVTQGARSQAEAAASTAEAEAGAAIAAADERIASATERLGLFTEGTAQWVAAYQELQTAQKERERIIGESAGIQEGLATRIGEIDAQQQQMYQELERSIIENTPGLKEALDDWAIWRRNLDTAYQNYDIDHNNILGTAGDSTWINPVDNSSSANGVRDFRNAVENAETRLSEDYGAVLDMYRELMGYATANGGENGDITSTRGFFEDMAQAAGLMTGTGQYGNLPNWETLMPIGSAEAFTDTAEAAQDATEAVQAYGEALEGVDRPDVIQGNEKALQDAADAAGSNADAMEEAATAAENLGEAVEGAEGAMSEFDAVRLAAAESFAEDMANAEAEAAQAVLDAADLTTDMTVEGGGEAAKNAWEQAQAFANEHPIGFQTQVSGATGLPGMARGGRASEATVVYGEAGPEWFVPEEHTRNTADLLLQAMRASGFSLADLARIAGGGMFASGGRYEPLYEWNPGAEAEYESLARRERKRGGGSRADADEPRGNNYVTTINVASSARNVPQLSRDLMKYGKKLETGMGYKARA